MRYMPFFVAASLASAMAVGSLASAQTAKDHIKNATAVGEVFGDGERITTVILEYDKKINNSKLSVQDFSVKDRNIVKVYANTTDAKVNRTRPLCAYPTAAQYKGTGSTDDERNFVYAESKPVGKR